MRHAAALLAVSLVSLYAPRAAAEPAARQVPSVVVVESPIAEKWLSQAGIPHTARPAISLGETPLAGVKLLILPMSAVGSARAARAVESFAAGGGRVIAVYWGTLVAPGGGTPPAHQLAEFFGVRPTGWLGEPPREVVLADAGGGALPFLGASVGLGGCQSVVVEPLPGTRVLARWELGEGSAPQPGSGAIFQRGHALFIAPNVLRPANDRPEVREMFFWAIQRAVPGPGLRWQAQDRIASASTACSAAGGLISWEASPEVRASLEAAQDALTEARGLLGRNPLKAIQAADRARTLAERLAEELRAPRRE